MKKPDRPQRARIPVNKEKKDPWRDAPKEEILARGKKTTDRPAAAPRAKKKEAGEGERRERPQRDETRGKKDFGGERAGKRDEARRDDRGPFKKSGFKKDDTRGPRKDGERDAPARPRRMAKGFGDEVKGERGERKSFHRRDDRPGEGRPPRSEKPFEKKPRRDDRREDSRSPRGEKPFSAKPHREGSADDKRPVRAEGPFPRKPRREDDRERGQAPRGERPFPPKRRREDDRDARAQRDIRPTRPNSTKRLAKDEDDEDDEAAPVANGPMTLNKYLAHAGLSSRRDAATAIKDGKVKVNGETLLTPGYRVQPDDKVTFEGKAMKPQLKKVYVLLNKPKGFITTTDDEMDRRTVMELVQAVEAERLYPVGRLDRNTTGLLLMTNDGDLAQRLTHPKYEAKKIYQVGLDKPLTKADFEKLLTTGVELEDGIAKPDKLSFLETPDELGLEIHSGRNRIVRRMFEALGYQVEKLDRVMFAGLTKKNIPRGQWRHLTEEEIVRLKHFKS